MLFWLRLLVGVQVSYVNVVAILPFRRRHIVRPVNVVRFGRRLTLNLSASGMLESAPKTVLALSTEVETTRFRPECRLGQLQAIQIVYENMSVVAVVRRKRTLVLLKIHARFG